MNAHLLFYRSLISCYPAAVRRELGDEMCYVFEQRLSEGSVTRTWLRELATAPRELARAWTEATLRRPPVSPAGFWIATAALMLAGGSAGSELIASHGFAFPISLLLLVALTIAAGAALGLARVARSAAVQVCAVVVAVSVFAAGAGGAILLDRAMLLSYRDASMSLPGVSVQAAARSSEADLADYAPLAAPRTTPRVRIEIHSTPETSLVRVVRGGGTDALYAAATILMLAGGIQLTSRRRYAA